LVLGGLFERLELDVPDMLVPNAQEFGNGTPFPTETGQVPDLGRSGGEVGEVRVGSGGGGGFGSGFGIGHFSTSYMMALLPSSLLWDKTCIGIYHTFVSEIQEYRASDTDVSVRAAANPRLASLGRKSFLCRLGRLGREA
jgi:hypothetical protein